MVFNPEDETHITYSTNKGLPHTETQEAVKDKNGNYWVLTNLGVSKLNPKTNTIQNFHITDDNNLERTFYELNETNVIFLKATKGFYDFKADKMNVNNNPPKMVFTDFKVFNKSLKNHRDSILAKHINVAKQIRLSHDKNDFTMEFAALHYADPVRMSINTYSKVLIRNGNI